MARYISADALLESVKSKRLIFEESTPVEEAIAEQVSVFEEAIEEAPPADVVEVVRCKDCQYKDECNQYVLMCGDEIELAFCSYGERRDQ